MKITQTDRIERAWNKEKNRFYYRPLPNREIEGVITTKNQNKKRGGVQITVKTFDGSVTAHLPVST